MIGAAIARKVVKRSAMQLSQRRSGVLRPVDRGRRDARADRDASGVAADFNAVGQVAHPLADESGADAVRGPDGASRPPAAPVLIAALVDCAVVEPILICARMLNLLLVLALTLLIFALARRLAGTTLAALCAALFWVLWEPVYGNILFYFDTSGRAAGHAGAALWIALSSRRPGWLAPLVCGLLLGGATLFKQPAWAGVILFALWLIR